MADEEKRNSEHYADASAVSGAKATQDILLAGRGAALLVLGAALTWLWLKNPEWRQPLSVHGEPPTVVLLLGGAFVLTVLSTRSWPVVAAFSALSFVGAAVNLAAGGPSTRILLSLIAMGGGLGALAGWKRCNGRRKLVA